MDCSCHLQAPAGLRQNKVSRHPLHVTGDLGACLGASEKGKYTILQNLSAKINILAISMKTVDREWLKSSIKWLKL
jgi:hypothetical protein